MSDFFEQVKRRVVESSVFRSIVRHGSPETDMNRSLVITSNIFLHVFPVKTKKNSLRFWYHLGLGAASLLLFLVLVVTGVLLMFYYTPYPIPAYRSIKDLQFAVFGGQILRNMHRWSAHGMVAIVFLHMARVFFTGAYKPPRQFNWVIGVLLLLVTLGLSFTGYLLPWDQLAYWAITVGTNIASYAPIVGEQTRFFLLGGHIVGEGALLRFYVLHCMVLPAAAVLLIGIHMWRLRKDGGLSSPPAEREVLLGPAAEVAPSKTYGLMAVVPGAPDVMGGVIPEDMEFTWPHLLTRELFRALLILNVLLIVSMIFPAPLEYLADPSRTPNPAKAPWYFLGLQELVHYSAFFGGVLAPALIVLGLLALPYLDSNPAGAGVWFAPERRLANGLFLMFALINLALIVTGTFLRGPGWGFFWPWEHWPQP